jgi:hypothetical protein
MIVFDTIVHKRTEYVPYVKSVNVTEHKAPTDESLKLLKEMEEAVINKIIASANITDNNIKFSCVLIENPLNMGYRLVCSFPVNGTEYKIDRNLSHVAFKSKSEIVNLVYNTILEEMSKIMSKIVTVGLLEEKIFTCTII